jgi:putative acetyltransferase
MKALQTGTETQQFDITVRMHSRVVLLRTNPVFVVHLQHRQIRKISNGQKLQRQAFTTIEGIAANFDHIYLFIRVYLWLNTRMITIRPIRPGEIPAAKHVILTVAYNIFGFDGTLEDSIRHFLVTGKLKDMDDLQTNYFDAGGTFLVALNGEQVIGSGALRRLDNETAELKRMWLLEAYHGQGIGYRLITQLFDFAREQGYSRARLQTSPEQVRALAFYRKVGFYEISSYNNDLDEISMEVKLSD